MSVQVKEVKERYMPSPKRYVRLCRYGCGKYIYWDDTVQDSKIKFIEEGSHILHTYHRCANLLTQQGKSLDVFSKEK